MKLRLYLIPLLFVLIGSICATWLFSIRPAKGEDGKTATATRQVASLEQRLQAGLRTRTEVEKEYVKRVVLFVQQGKLPQKLVDSTFLWVRKNKPNCNYPLFYFKRVLELRGKALRIPVPK